MSKFALVEDPSAFTFIFSSLSYLFVLHKIPDMNRETLAALAVVKWILEVIESYNGAPEKLKEYLIHELERKDVAGDTSLAQAGDSLLQS